MIVVIVNFFNQQKVEFNGETSTWLNACAKGMSTQTKLK